MKFPRTQWKVHDIFQIMLGSPSTKSPKKLMQRVIYINLVLLSMRYASDIFSQLTDIKVTYTNKPFETPEQINASGFPIYLAKFVEKQTRDDPHPILGGLKSKISPFSTDNCCQRLVSRNNRFCIVPYALAQYYIEKSMNIYGRPTVKITTDHLLPDYVAFAYEKGSPYVERFDRIIQWIIEGGIAEFSKKYKFGGKFYNTGENKTILLPQLLVILSFGYFFGILAFLCERRCTNRVNRK